jgi:four helix bundle protein
MGSASEVEYDLLVARDLGFLNNATFQQLESDVIEVKKMVTSLIKKLKADS